MDRYRVIVLREGTDADETLFEIAGPARRLMRIAPGAVLDSLDEDEQERAGSTPLAGRELAERVFDSASAAARAAETQGAGVPANVADESAAIEAAKTKRKRRTKAEIAADEAAQAAGFRDAAHRAEAEAQQQQTAPGGPDPATVTTTFEGTAPVPPAAPAPAPAGDGEPWNPFVQPTH